MLCLQVKLTTTNWFWIFYCRLYGQFSSRLGSKSRFAIFFATSFVRKTEHACRLSARWNNAISTLRGFCQGFTRYFISVALTNCFKLRPFMIRKVDSTPRAISTSQISEVFSAFSRWWRKVLHARKKKWRHSERISQRAQLCLRKTVVSHLKWTHVHGYSIHIARIIQ